MISPPFGCATSVFLVYKADIYSVTCPNFIIRVIKVASNISCSALDISLFCSFFHIIKGTHQ